MRSPKSWALVKSATVMGLLVACATPIIRSPERQPASTYEDPIARVCDGASVGIRSYRYCIQYSKSSRSKSVLYYLHGVGGSEESWENPIHQSMERDWAGRAVEKPAVITVTFGSTWFVSDEAGAISRSTQDLFVNEIMPKLEALLPNGVEERVLFGESMGGFNAVQLLMKQPQLWKRVVLGWPAILAVGPMTPRKDVEAFINRQKPFGRRNLIERWLGKLKNAFRQRAIWIRHNPIDLASESRGDLPKVLILAGESDGFGFYEGTAVFAQALRARGVPVVFKGIPRGDHVRYSERDAKDVARFLY